MCEFFSFIQTSRGQFLYFDAKARAIKTGRGRLQGREADSHSIIASRFKVGIDRVNKYEYDPVAQDLVLDHIAFDYIDGEKASALAKRWVKSLDFTEIIPGLTPSLLKRARARRPAIPAYPKASLRLTPAKVAAFLDAARASLSLDRCPAGEIVGRPYDRVLGNVRWAPALSPRLYDIARTLRWLGLPFPDGPKGRGLRATLELGDMGLSTSGVEIISGDPRGRGEYLRIVAIGHGRGKGGAVQYATIDTSSLPASLRARVARFVRRF